MAEFQEVMRQWVRARKATASSAEENVLSVYLLEEYDDALIADIEKNVMQWAAEHPEPVYPTWLEWLSDMGLIIKNGDAYTFHFIRATKHIPSDIAEKLGLEAKEGAA